MAPPQFDSLEYADFVIPILKVGRSVSTPPTLLRIWVMLLIFCPGLYTLTYMPNIQTWLVYFRKKTALVPLSASAFKVRINPDKSESTVL